MSRVAKQPVSVPKGVDVSIDGRNIAVKGPKGNASMVLHELVSIEQHDAAIQHERSSQGHTLCFATGKAVRIAARQVRE